jgi:hypothetical protein
MIWQETELCSRKNSHRWKKCSSTPKHNSAHMNLGDKNTSLISELPSGNEILEEESCSGKILGRCTPVWRTSRIEREHDGTARMDQTSE